MEYDIDQFSRDITERLKGLLNELKRLAAENERLVRENRELREEVTLARLHSELGGETAPAGKRVPLRPPDAMLSPEELQFYRTLPEKINFTDFFRLADAEGLSNRRARELMLLFFRQGLLDQRGRRLEKRAMSGTVPSRETQGA